MATAGGRLLQHLAKHGTALKQAWSKAALALEGRLNPLLKPQAELIPVRASQPLHPVARIRQNASRRWYTTRSHAFQRTRETLRQYTTSPSAANAGPRYNSASFPVSRTSTLVSRLPGRSPFAHTLRPNLTGGALPRTSSGYTLGSGRLGGPRYFSSGPAAPAQVVSNVSAAVRAFWLSGSKAQYDGIDSRTGEKRFRAVSARKDGVMRKIKSSFQKTTPGSYVDFAINPAITALTSFGGVAMKQDVFDDEEAYDHKTAETHLNTSGLLDVLHTDFSRSLRDLSAILADLTRLASLGDLPMTYEPGSTFTGPSLRIRFPGVDAETVEKLCEEMSVTRGVVAQDEDFDDYIGSEMALKFPFAPSKPVSEYDIEEGIFERKAQEINWQETLDSRSVLSEVEQQDTGSASELDIDEEDLSIHSDIELADSNPWLSSPEEGYASDVSPVESYSGHLPTAEDFDGLRRFIELCDSADGSRRRV